MNVVNDALALKPAMKNSFLCSAGPWGRLEAVPILISPPVEFSAYFEEEQNPTPIGTFLDYLPPTHFSRCCSWLDACRCYPTLQPIGES